MKLYVAENDEHGEIACIWMSDPSRRTPRVFDPRRHRYDATEPAAFSGVSEKVLRAHLSALMRAEDRDRRS